MSMQAHYLTLIKQRWPELYQQLNQLQLNEITVTSGQNTLIINDIQLTSDYDPIEEAKLQIEHIPFGISQVTVYGPAMGDQIACLLERQHLMSIDVVLLSYQVFLAVLNYCEQLQWLAEPRINLRFAKTNEAIAEHFCVAPAELVLAEQAAWPLRDNIEQTLNHDFIQQQNIAKVEIQQNLNSNLAYVAKDDGISTLLSNQHAQVFLVAAGPSLEDNIDKLRDKEQFIIAVDAAVPYLLAQDIKPDIIMSVDYTAFQFFAAIDLGQLTDVTLVYFPSIDSRVLAKWPGKRYCAYSNTPLFSAYLAQYPKPLLFSAGSVIHPAFDLASKIATEQVVLFGTDFGFTREKSHAGDSQASHMLDKDIADTQLVNYQGNTIKTMTSFKNYLRDLEKFIQQQHVAVRVASSKGAKIAGVELWQA